MATTTHITALRTSLIVLVTVLTAVFASAGAASAAPNDDSGTTTNVPNVPIEIPTVEIPDFVVPDTPILQVVGAKIDVDCSADPSVATVTFTNNTLSATAFQLTVFGSKDGTTETIKVAEFSTEVRTIIQVDSASISVTRGGKTLDEVVVNCSPFGQLAPGVPPFLDLAEEPIAPTPEPTPAPTTTPLGPWIGTDAAVNQVICGGSSEPNQIVVQLVNGSNGDRTFHMTRSTTNTIEPRSVTLVAGEARLEVFDAIDGSHVVQVSVDVVPILEELVLVDCTEAAAPTPPQPAPEPTATPEAAPQPTPAAPPQPTPEAPTPEAPGAPSAEQDAELAAVPPAPIDEGPAANDAATPLAVVGSQLTVVLIALGAALVGCVGFAGVAIGRRSV